MQTAIAEAARGRVPVRHDGRLLYEWEQDLTDVHIYLKPPPKTEAKEISVRISPNKLAVGLIGKPPLFDEELSSTVETAASFWMMEDGELHIQLGKMRKGEVWKSALKGHATLNPLAAEEVQKKLMLERFGEEHPGFDFSGATFSGSAPDPRSFMGGISYK
ncbi:nuclear movement domain-containing protein, putative [Eimeria tenella]|uniref:Nuclear movement domain-containing protein, putative n=1 Tax=Eimeria tenella TaxID=5802 RepID=U6KK65_EIMTE|nr:nuclear movement domain-containing protein, putative [Eimeria tenella]CDJ38395.1 nuclear movement domain-containing protein, putative [Eimeria tenella]|eukprot:XP_013229233.1 nuclear movement domain-containing protein, putative [Eimeria tenella]